MVSLIENINFEQNLKMTMVSLTKLKKCRIGTKLHNHDGFLKDVQDKFI